MSAAVDPRHDGAVSTPGPVNRVLVRLLEGGAGRRLGRHLAVVEYAGRRSGRCFRLVTTYSRNGQVVTIRVGMPGRKTWWRNFRETHPVRLRLEGRTYDASAHVVKDGALVTVVAELADRRDGTP